VPTHQRRRSAPLRVLTAFSSLALLAIAPGCRRGPEGVDLGRHVEHPEFSSERAWSFLTSQIANGPRYAGHVGHQRTLAWLREQLAIRADTVYAQEFTHRTASGDTLRMANVVARFSPALPDRVLLVAHWDTRRFADKSLDAADQKRPVPGANDGASGVAVLMELAELFRQQRPGIGVDLLLTDGEDYGPGAEDMFLGAKHFAARPMLSPKPRYAIVLDMVGDADARFRPEENSLRQAPEVVKRVWGLAQAMGRDSVFSQERREAITDDHVFLNQAGIPSIVVIDLEYGPGNLLWHTVEDDASRVSRETLGVVGEVIAEHVYRGFPAEKK
ncbi:MAG TPA: M28 family peptidase, partial [Longimicrobium sp.]|nr:M28 family peptidase [Longimicrobium sp.]